MHHFLSHFLGHFPIHSFILYILQGDPPEMSTVLVKILAKHMIFGYFWISFDDSNFANPTTQFIKQQQILQERAEAGQCGRDYSAAGSGHQSPAGNRIEQLRQYGCCIAARNRTHVTATARQLRNPPTPSAGGV